MRVGKGKQRIPVLEGGGRGGQRGTRGAELIRVRVIEFGHCEGLAEQTCREGCRRNVGGGGDGVALVWNDRKTPRFSGEPRMIPVGVIVDEIIVAARFGECESVEKILVGEERFDSECAEVALHLFIARDCELRKEMVEVFSGMRFPPLRESFFVKPSGSRRRVPDMCRIRFVDKRESDQRGIILQRKSRVRVDVPEEFLCPAEPVFIHAVIDVKERLVLLRRLYCAHTGNFGCGDVAA